MKLLVTGSNGLIGAEVCTYFGARDWQVHGIDNNQRAVIFGPEGDTRWNQQRLETTIPGYRHRELDIRDRGGMLNLYEELRPDATVHAAAQPSHNHARRKFRSMTSTSMQSARSICSRPLVDTRLLRPSSILSTNKVYGDAPNRLALREAPTRWEYDDPEFEAGIPESLTVDQSKHSLFGASKLAADVMVQEYGRYFNIPTACLRADASPVRTIRESNCMGFSVT